ncbi:MAG: carboxypeptidase regulatory-like domain-containing protein, partial [bacterium]
FIDNNSAQQGVQGSALRLLNVSRGVIRHTLFIRNQTAGSGAGIYATGESQFTAIHCLFLENRSARFGGGVLTTGSATRGEFLNTLFVGNRAGIDGGGAAVSVNSNSTFAFSTFYENRAEGDNSMGGGFYKGSNSNPQIINSIFWNNQAAVGPQLYGQDNGGVITIAYCLIEGGADELGQADVGEGIIDEDPQFVEGREPDWGIAGFFLDPESPAVDTGDDQAQAWGMDTLTTQADLAPDRGTADLGFHYDPDDFTRVGFLYGWVTRSRDGEPLPDATVLTSRGDRALTDEEGYWEMPQARIGVLQITASKQWYLPVTQEVELGEDDTLEVHFALPQPLISLRPQRIEVSLNAGDSTDTVIQMANPGDGRLDWRASVRLHPDDEIPLWESRMTIPASQITGDPRLNGVAFDGEFFYVAGSADQDHNYIYILDREGQQEVERFE